MMKIRARGMYEILRPPGLSRDVWVFECASYEALSAPGPLRSRLLHDTTSLVFCVTTPRDNDLFVRVLVGDEEVQGFIDRHRVGKLVESEADLTPATELP